MACSQPRGKRRPAAPWPRPADAGRSATARARRRSARARCAAGGGTAPRRSQRRAGRDSARSRRAARRRTRQRLQRVRRPPRSGRGARALSAPVAGHLRDQLPAAAEHDRAPCRRIPRAARRACRAPRRERRAPPSSRSSTAGRAFRRVGAARQNGVEGLEEMRQPVARVPHVGPLVLQPEHRAAHLAKQRGPIDLPCRSSTSTSSAAPVTAAQRGEMRAHRLGSKLPSRPSCDTRPAALAAAGSKWYLRSR